jgi:hypothetical protein
MLMGGNVHTLCFEGVAGSVIYKRVDHLIGKCSESGLPQYGLRFSLRAVHSRIWSST